jgi:hypothetical protein
MKRYAVNEAKFQLPANFPVSSSLCHRPVGPDQQLDFHSCFRATFPTLQSVGLVISTPPRLDIPVVVFAAKLFGLCYR